MTVALVAGLLSAFVAYARWNQISREPQHTSDNAFPSTGYKLNDLRKEGDSLELSC